MKVMKNKKKLRSWQRLEKTGPYDNLFPFISCKAWSEQEAFEGR